MAETLDRTRELRMPRTVYVSPFLPMEAITYFNFIEELRQVKQRLLELESKQRVIVLREITREEAKKEIAELFKSGRTLHYSDIAQELKVDLETVVDICNELESNGQIEVDANVLSKR